MFLSILKHTEVLVRGCIFSLNFMSFFCIFKPFQPQGQTAKIFISILMLNLISKAFFLECQRRLVRDFLTHSEEPAKWTIQVSDVLIRLRFSWHQPAAKASIFKLKQAQIIELKRSRTRDLSRSEIIFVNMINSLSSIGIYQKSPIFSE